MSNKFFNKYEVRKRDGTEVDPDAIYFVLRLDSDPAARRALRTYIHECYQYNPGLARDLQDTLVELRKDLRKESQQ
jgi:hypothetical protein